MDIDVARLAHLAKFRFSDEELASCQIQMERIILMLQSLSETEGEEMDSLSVFPSTLRKDEEGESLSREALLQNAPQVQKEHFCVPRTFEED